jgi:hypothetical protein
LNREPHFPSFTGWTRPEGSSLECRISVVWDDFLKVRPIFALLLVFSRPAALDRIELCGSTELFNEVIARGGSDLAKRTHIETL